MTAARDALWESGHDESVEVNQRALIDKVLARYSGEFTVFRELLQNSDDARSTVVEIRFETKQFLDKKDKAREQGGFVDDDLSSLPNLKTAVVHQWTFKNNGVVFRDEDWTRLKKIAEGNPDEEKIGAFGVGFYSLFSVTEEPFVTSGDSWMGFYWKDKKDQLFARRGQLPSSDEIPWTSFEMGLREAAPIPVPFDFARFLASSITFMTCLKEVSVYFDDKRLVKLTKDSGIPRELGIPKGLRRSSTKGIMTVKAINSTPLHIKADIMRWVYTSGSEKPRINPPPIPTKPSGGTFFSSLFATFAGGATPLRTATPLPALPVEVVDPLTINETSVALSIFSADVDVLLDKKMSAELHRSTKKNPPKKLKYELIYTAKDEYDVSRKEDTGLPFASGSIFQGLRADLDGTGSARVFIGHATAQTTGIGGHMATRFIPTVERESIDLMDRNVAIWNKELLYVGGFLARSAYELELDNIQNLWEGSTQQGNTDSTIDSDLQSWLRGRSLHALKFFTFHQSTPSADVSNLLEDAFFSCAPKNQFPLISTAGVRNAFDVRYPDTTFSGFLKQLPVLPEDVLTAVQSMVVSLQSRGMIKAITFDDVLKELRSRPLIEDEMVACLNWWVAMNKQGDAARLSRIRTELLNAAVLSIGKPHSEDERIIALSSIKTFINIRGMGGAIPLGGPLPTHLLPIAISKNFSPDSIIASFPWTELTIVEWLSHVCNPTTSANVEHDINLSASWAENVLNVLSRAWPSLSNPDKAEIVLLLKNKTCIPTSGGMKTPDQSYFANANIFHDLPVVTLPSKANIKGTLERVLMALGVRKHVELQVVFNRMIKTNEWTIADLAKYLVSVRSTLTSEELARLKVTSAFSKERVTKQDENNDVKPMRYQARQLYEPLDVFRSLGLPVVDWGTQTKWRGSSEEAKLLFELGLLRFPPLEVLVGLCANEDLTTRSIALKYLLDNIGDRYQDYEPAKFSTVSFVPALRENKECLCNPLEVYSSAEWSRLGFSVVHPNVQQDARIKLKIKQHPPTAHLVSLLAATPPKEESEAKTWFGILAGRIHDFSTAELKRLSQLPMVPIHSTSKEGKVALRWLPATQCFFGGESNDKFHSKLFVFVDFGTPANGFLSACGTKHEPSVEEIARMLIDDPIKFYTLAEGHNHFLAELRNIAVNSRLISPGTMNIMKKSAILLGSRRKSRNSTDKTEKGADSLDDLDIEERDLEYDLKLPNQIIIADDTHAHQAFGDSLFTAPQEDILEGFYAALGSRRLSSLVKEEYQTTAEVKNSKIAGETRALILERLPLFLHEHTHARTRVSYSWLATHTNFVVKTYGKLTVTKSLHFGELHLSRQQDASAVAKRFGYGTIELWLAGNSQIDMYEVAISLNRLLFESPKANDALLFMTILSTDLKALKRRGYNVDRILRQQKAERQATEEAKAKAENAVLLSEQKFLGDQNSSGSRSEVKLQESLPDGKPTPLSSAANSIQNMRRKLGSSIQANADKFQTTMAARGLSGSTASPSFKPNPPSVPESTRPKGQESGNPAVTPLSHISSNIDMAISACRPESRNLLQNREAMQQIKESLNEGYCDVSGRVGDLKYIGAMGKVKVYLSQEVPQANTFMANKQDALARFIHIMTWLAQVYKLPLTSLHVFYDVAGGTIAFNRDGSIFLNLRYFEAWHDDDASKGNLNPAYISWYFTLAHEIAHNLVQPHNSEHEFYFSAICEKHIMDLGRALSSL